jgi:hypothetical protein
VVVVGRNDYALEVAVVVDGGFGYLVVMAVVEVEVEVVVGFGCAVELRTLVLADGECQCCIAFLQASLAPC